MFKYFILSVFALGLLLTSCEEEEQSEDLTQILFSSTGEFTDERDGNTYKTVEIGGVTWMAENLAYLPKVHNNEDFDPDLNGKNIEHTVSRKESRYYVYKNFTRDVATAKESAYYKTYGVLYNWYAATQGALVRNQTPSGVKGICPDGWHLPSDAEWSTLVAKLGLSSGIRAKSVTGWESNGNGNNTGGLELVPGGMYLPLLYEFDQSNEDGFNFLITKGKYYGATLHGGWWTSTSTEGPDVSRDLQFNAMSWTTSSNLDQLLKNNIDQGSGLSVRCVKDAE